MRLTPKSPPKKPLRRPDPPKKTATLAPHRPRSVSWWTTACQPDQREQFAAAARQRNLEAQCDPEWRRADKFGQIGQL